MSRINIQNFGPIKDNLSDNNGWIDIAKVTVFIGNQGSGKSTVAKLISTFTWIEKALVRGDFTKKDLERKNKLKSKFLPYHRLENYLKDDTFIAYEGDAYQIVYSEGFLHIDEAQNQKYALPQIMYVPAERNFLSYLKKARELKLSSDALQEFLTEYEDAKSVMKGSVALPIGNVFIEYNKLNDIVYVKGSDYRIQLSEASSGYQSLVPLNLVSHYLANSVKTATENNKEPMSSEEMNRFKKGISDIMSNNKLTDEQKRIAVSAISDKFNKTAFINVVEEPEQNLYPSSQKEMLFALLADNNMSVGNKLIMTTHSPYIINYLSIAIQGEYLYSKIEKSSKKDSFLAKLYQLVPKESLVSANDIFIYQLDEKEGNITKLSAIDGIPSDENFLNKSLAEGNFLFDSLLEIEQEL